MNSKTLRFALLAGALAGWGLLAVSSCSKGPPRLLLPNQRPSVELTNAPVAPDRSNPYFYAYRVEWSGYDPDGRVDHYDYAIDPTAKDCSVESIQEASIVAPAPVLEKLRRTEDGRLQLFDGAALAH